MKTTLLYDDMLKFDETIQTMIENSDVLVYADQLVFNINTPASGENAYIYRKCEHSFFQRIEMNLTMENIEKAQAGTGNVKYMIFNAVLPDDVLRAQFYEIVLIVFDPVGEDKQWIGYVYFTIDKKYEALLNKLQLQKKIFLRVDYLINSIRINIENYEKLYYLIDFFSEIVTIKDRFMPYHMTNVANWAMLIANEMNLDYKDQLTLYVAALIHDIGIVYIPEKILSKSTPLSEEEYNLMKQIPEKSYEITKTTLYGMHFFENVPTVIRYHREWFDGSGYPFNKRGTDIPLLSRIVSVADATDAMLSRRAYRDLLSEEFVVKELLKGSGKQFDPEIVNIMIGLIRNKHKNKGKSFVEDTNFIPQTSLNFYYDSFKNQRSYVGNLIMNEKTGKLIIHSGDSFEEFELNRIYKPSISFFALNDFLEYEVKLLGRLNNQILMTGFKYVPTDKYFSLIWELIGILKTPSNRKGNVKIIKVGGDTLVFEVVDQYFKEILISSIDKTALIDFDLEIDHTHNRLSLTGRILRFFNFQNVTVFVFKFTNINSAERDSILRMLFRKQTHDKQVRMKIKKS
ncbi:HD-GYP domain-containing protein [Fusibacter ferrireducens]|uniref:HD domain-containing protein n=1 Tax=Fusibacter ferrireducens TaxID=2785058 RepID=A0ABR9ZRI0_9FIRM|nr:HD domain-containing phosphohydrolase [Fusibacter ferrireducens]MBF4693058.1 HD domain-containing protein [Fusibacter ferrireducens]